MHVQVVLPDEDPSMTPTTLVDLAVETEALGYHSVWLPDHLLPPEPYGATYGGVYEPLVTLAFLAARTRRIRLGTSVLVLPMRNPFVVAKQVATLDALSGGRLTLGVGIGWDAEEFAAVGADFSTRGARTDDALALLRHLFTAEDGSGFHGAFHRYPRGVFAPRPAGSVPLMVGGTSARALRRAAEWADEWQGVGLDPDAFARCVTELRGRRERPITVGTRVECTTDADVAEVAALAARFEAAGADTLAVWFGDHQGTGDRARELAAALSLTGG